MRPAIASTGIVPGLNWSGEEKASVIHQVRDLSVRSTDISVNGRTPRGVYHQIQALRRIGVLPDPGDKRYSPAEDQLIIRMVREGKKLQQLEVEGRSPASLYSHLKLLRRKGHKRLELKRLWTRSEDHQIILQIVTLGKRPGEVTIPNRSKTSAYDRIKVLRRQGKITKYFRRLTKALPWKGAEIEAVLRASSRNGHHRGAVALKNAGLFPQRTVASLNRIISKLGLSDPERSQAVKSRLKLTAERKQELREWLEHEGRCMPTALVAKRFGFKPDFITHFRQRYELQIDHGKAINDATYRAWHAEQVCRRKEARVAVNHRRREERLQHMTNLDAVLKALRSTERKKACRVCGRKWFATRDFFRLRSQRKRNGQERFIFQYTCWVCPPK